MDDSPQEPRTNNFSDGKWTMVAWISYCLAGKIFRQAPSSNKADCTETSFAQLYFTLTHLQSLIIVSMCYFHEGVSRIITGKAAGGWLIHWQMFNNWSQFLDQEICSGEKGMKTHEGWQSRTESPLCTRLAQVSKGPRCHSWTGKRNTQVQTRFGYCVTGHAGDQISSTPFRPFSSKFTPTRNLESGTHTHTHPRHLIRKLCCKRKDLSLIPRTCAKTNSQRCSTGL